MEAKMSSRDKWQWEGMQETWKAGLPSKEAQNVRWYCYLVKSLCIASIVAGLTWGITILGAVGIYYAIWHDIPALSPPATLLTAFSGAGAVQWSVHIRNLRWQRWKEE